MAIYITDNSDNVSGALSPTLADFSTDFDGEYTAPGTSSFDGSLNRALENFTCAFVDRDWPQNGWAMQGGYQIANVTNNLTEPNLTWNAEKDIFISQGLGWTLNGTLEDYATNYSTLKAINPNLKILHYIIANNASQTGGVLDANKRGGVGYPDQLAAMLLSSSRGKNSWITQNGAGTQLYGQDLTAFDVDCYSPQFLEENSFGRVLHEQFLFEHWQAWNVTRAAGKIIDFCDGIFIDVVPPIPQVAKLADGSNAGVGDFDRDGSSESRTDETDGAGVEANYGGARMHRRGCVGGYGANKNTRNWYDYFHDLFGPDQVLSHNGTEDGIRYDFELNAGDPYQDSEFYQRWDHAIFENAQNDLGIKDVFDGTYFVQFNGWETFFRRYERIRLSLRQDSAHPWGSYGQYAVLVEVNMSTRTPIDLDYDYHRFWGGVCALCGGVLGANQNKSTASPPLDEYLYAWGDPIDPNHPNIGTTDVTVANSFTMRSADYSASGNNFWWVEFDNVLWVVRGDFPSSGSNYGSGSAANCELPNPGTGKKWIHPDLTAYTNPTTGYTTRNQAPTLNDGSDVTAGGTYGIVSLLPAHAVMLARADA